MFNIGLSKDAVDDDLLEENIDAYDKAMDNDDDGIDQPGMDEMEEDDEDDEDDRDEEDNIPPSETNDELKDYNELEF